MTLDELQQAVDQWISRHEEGYWPPLANLARLSEEVGELAREINHHHGPKRKKDTESEGSVAEEMGDILFTLATLANALEIDLGKAARDTLDKVVARDAERWTRRPDGGADRIDDETSAAPVDDR